MHTPISTKDAPAAIGPYSQAVRAGDLLFLSGQIPLDPTTGQLVAGDIQRQTERVMKNLAAVLAAAGATMDNVVRTTIYLVDLTNFADVNAEYAKHFTKTAPARATVEVSKLPKGAQVEIEAIAVLSTATGS
jgi:2-iminobutanoate/2-iminopropanoate deaminase